MAWTLKRLTSCFNRATARPHRPRSAAIRRLMRVAGIPIPERQADDPARGGDDDGLEEGEEEASMEDDPVVEPPLEIEGPSVEQGKSMGHESVAAEAEGREPVNEDEGPPNPKQSDLVAIAPRAPKLRRMVAKPPDPQPTPDKSTHEAPEKATSSKTPSEDLAAMEMPPVEKMNPEGARAT